HTVQRRLAKRAGGACHRRGRSRASQDGAGEVATGTSAAAHRLFRLLAGQPEPATDVSVEPLEEERARLGHSPVDAVLEVLAQGIEGPTDLLGGPTGLVDVQHSPLEVHPALQGAEDLVGGAEHPVEEVELLLQNLVEAGVGGVLTIQEVEDQHVALLAIAVAP